MLNVWKQAWKEHKLLVMHFAFILVATVILLIVSIFSAIMNSFPLRISLDVFTIVLNFGSAYFIMLIYFRIFLKGHLEHVQRMSEYMRQYEDIKRQYKEASLRYPNSIPPFDLEPPADSEKSYRRLSWVYFIGGGINLFLGIMNIVRLIQHLS